MTKNADIKKYMKFCGVAQWRVAELLNIHEVTLNRWLRFDLTPERRKAILDAVDKVAGELRQEVII